MLQEMEQANEDVRWEQCTGAEFAAMAAGGLAWLERHYEQVNELNVFPVPDGDTGTNMLWTMRAACQRLEARQGQAAGSVASALARGALMGARGNSGVILSQFWQGFAQGLGEKDVLDADGLARALAEAETLSYRAVVEPVEGTILTVIRSAAEAAQGARRGHSFLQALERVLRHAQQALARTPEMLPILRQAGVVDSGGQGLVFILEGMLRQLRQGAGQMIVLDEGPAAARTQSPQALAAPAGGALPFPYDVQFLLVGHDLDLGAVRQAIERMGDSALVVGDEQTIKVHVHVVDPGVPLSYGVSVGRIEDIVVENMQSQMEVAGGQAVTEEQAAAAEPAREAGAPAAALAVVAVAAGPGLAAIFRDMGASQIVSGGQSANPSTEQILEAIEAADAAQVVVLPNNKNILMAADAAARLASKHVHVVPTRTVPQGIGAMLAFGPEGELENTAAAMTDAAQLVTSAAIARASRSVTLEGIDVEQGAFIGTLDGKLCASAPSVEAVMQRLLQQMGAADYELLSIYYGGDVSEADAEAFVGFVEGAYPELEVELFAGGQPHYHYLIGAE